MRSIPLPLAVLAAFALAGCAHSAEPAGQSRQKLPSPQRVSGRLLESQPFCGGTAPEFAINPATPRASSIELLVFSGGRNSQDAPFTKVAPGSDGRFELQLPPGEWCFVEADRPSEQPPRLNPPAQVDAACWRERWARCLGTVEVNDAPVEMGELLLVRHCPWADPCISGLPKAPRRIIPPAEQQVPPRPGPNPPPPPPAPTRR